MAVKKSLRTTVSDVILEQIMTVVTAMKSKDGDDKKAAEDKANKAKQAEEFKKITLESAEARSELSADQ
jgi:hypothetical protein